jgi:hypothetical protein
MIDKLLGRSIAYDELLAEARHLLADVDALAADNAALLFENARLRQASLQLSTRAHALHPALRIVNDAYCDALVLLAWAEAGLSLSRRACLRSGLSTRRWQWATGLLRMAGVLRNGVIRGSSSSGRRHYRVAAIQLALPLSEAADRLAAAYERAQADLSLLPLYTRRGSPW